MIKYRLELSYSVTPTAGYPLERFSVWVVKPNGDVRFFFRRSDDFIQQVLSGEVDLNPTDEVVMEEAW